VSGAGKHDLIPVLAETATFSWCVKQQYVNQPVDEVNAIYPPPVQELMYRQNLSFVDASPELGQVFPGFAIDVPTLA
jgi:hypothetical protein